MMLVLAALTTSGHCRARAGDRELTESSDFRVRVQAALRLGRTGGASSRADLEVGPARRSSRRPCRMRRRARHDGRRVRDPRAPAGDEDRVVSEREDVDEGDHRQAARRRRRRRRGGRGGSGPARASRRRSTSCSSAPCANTTGQRADLDSVMRSAARAKAGSIKGAVILDNPDAAILRRAGERKIPVLLVDGSLTRLSQSTGRDGGLTVSAQVDLSIRRVPQQTLKGMVSGNGLGERRRAQHEQGHHRAAEPCRQRRGRERDVERELRDRRAREVSRDGGARGGSSRKS